MRQIRTKGAKVQAVTVEPVAAVAGAEPVAQTENAQPGALVPTDIAVALQDLEAGLVNLREQKRQHDRAGRELEERLWQQEGAIKFARLLLPK